MTELACISSCCHHLGHIQSKSIPVECQIASNYAKKTFCLQLSRKMEPSTCEIKGMLGERDMLQLSQHLFDLLCVQVKGVHYLMLSTNM